MLKAKPTDAKVEEVPEPQHPANRALVEYYDSKSGSDGLVGRGDIRPAELATLLPGMFMAEPVDGGADMLFRLIGTEIEERTGLSATGRRLTEVYPKGAADDFLAFYRRVISGLERITIQGRLFGIGIDHALFECTLLPVRARDGKSVMVVGGFFDLKDVEDVE